MPFLKRENAEIWYELRGPSGTVITLISGHTRTTSDYDQLSKGLVAAGYRVLVLDNRGSGKTRSSLSFTCQEMIADIAAVWAHLEIETTCLVGFSMGGYLALATTISLPERVERLALLSTSAQEHHVNLAADSWILDTKNNLDAKLRNFFSAEFQKANPLYMHKMIEATKAAVEDGRFALRAAAQKDALFKFTVVDHLGEINCPVLIVHGRSDVSISLAAPTELQSHIKQSKLIWLEDTAHFCIIERPVEILAALVDFLT